eukprot:m.91779 g.91779  ORF g.91779 m.91779 type:complete len:542 (-) comp8615_c0_seq1:313-1938(-)
MTRRLPFAGAFAVRNTPETREHERTHRRVVLALAEFFVLTGSLTVGGFMALLPTLLDDGKFADLCDTADGADDNCPERQRALSQMMIMAGIACNAALLPGGYIHDRFGPRSFGVLGGLILAAGGIMLAALDNTMLLYLSFGLISAGNFMLFFAMIHLANLEPHHRGSIVTVFRLSEPFSAGIFFIFNRLYQSGAVPNLLTLFSVYSVIPLGFVVFCYLCQPDTAYTASMVSKSTPVSAVSAPDTGIQANSEGARGFEPSSEAGATERTDLIVEVPRTSHSSEKDGHRPRLIETYRTTHMTAREQLRSPELAVFSIWSGVIIAFTWLYESTVYEQMIHAYNASESQATHASDVYTYWFMFGPVLSLPLGTLLDRQATWSAMTLLGLCFALFVALLLGPYEAQLFGAFPTYIIARTSVFSAWTHFGNVAAGPRIGFFLGMAALVSALFLLTDLGLVRLVTVTNPHLFYIIPIYAAVAAIVTFAFALFLRRRLILVPPEKFSQADRDAFPAKLPSSDNTGAASDFRSDGSASAAAPLLPDTSSC